MPVTRSVRFLGATLLTALLVAFPAGCGEGKTVLESIEPSVGYGGAVLGQSVEGRPIVVERFGRAGPVVFLFHTIHGNEGPAEQCAQRMRSWLLGNPASYEQLQVVFISQVNPDGFVASTRHNANGIDLNRNFPASNFEPSDTYGPSPASEPETQAVVQVMEKATPVVVVSVHSPLEVINYDGPAQEVVELASQATGIPVDVDLGPYPGSFGSYSGLDLQIPTLTLETPGTLLSKEEHRIWIRVEEIALEWLADQGAPAGPDLSELVVDQDSSDGYQVIGLGDSAGGRPLIAEQFGHEGKPILVVAGLDGSDMAVLCAERLRAELLGRSDPAATQRKVLLMTVANPDGLAADRPLDDDGLDPDKSFARGFTADDESGTEPFQCIEAAAIRDLIEASEASAVVVLQSAEDQLRVSADGPASALLQAAGETLYSSYEDLDSDRPGTLAAWAGERGIPALTIEVPELPAEVDLLRADNLGQVLLSVVDAVP